MSIRRTTIALSLLGILVAAPQAAQADKETSIEIYKKGKKKYNLGDFAEAIPLFKQAYDEFEAPAYLYNIAQAYRQLDDCKKALFFYERFLAEKPGSSQEATIQGYVKTLKGECGDSASDPGALNEIDEPVKKPDGTESDDEVAVSNDSASADTSTTSTTVRKPALDTESGPLVAATAELGPAFFNIGEVVVPVSGTLRLGGAYSMKMGDISIEPGLSILLSNMAYEEAAGDSSLLFTSAFANVAASIPVASALRVGGELGLGLFRYGSLAQGNPFSTGGMEVDGATTSFGLRVGVTAEYSFSEALGFSLSPGYSYAGAGDELASDIGSISNFQLLGGVRYRL
jgi:hypothetical protein